MRFLTKSIGLTNRVAVILDEVNECGSMCQSAYPATPLNKNFTELGVFADGALGASDVVFTALVSFDGLDFDPMSVYSSSYASGRFLKGLDAYHEITD